MARSLDAVLQRRLLDWEDEPERGAPPARPPVAARLSDVEAWLNGCVDEALLTRWLSRLALFDWSFVPPSVRELAKSDSHRAAVDSALALYGLLQPLFGLRPVLDERQGKKRDLLAPETGARTPAAARRMAAVIRGGDVERALDVARSRYAMAGAPLMRMDAPWDVVEPERMLAGLLFLVSNRDGAVLVRRWLRPQRQPSEVIHA